MTVKQASIIVCTHNRSDKLPGVIGQLRAQNYPPDAFEILVVNNCSTDNTKDVVGQFVTEPGVVVYSIEENRPGVTYARNRGAQEAHYPYLAYLDDDCSVDPDWLSQLLSGFDLDERVVIVAGRIIVDFDNLPRPKWLGTKSERWLGAYDHPGSQPRLLEFPLYVCEGNMALKRDTWEAIGGFLGMDQFGSPHVASQEIGFFLKQIERRGDKVAFVPKALVHHHPGIPTQQWILRRAYLHGISDAVLDYFLYKRSWVSVLYHALLDTAAMIIFLFLTAFFYLTGNPGTAMYHRLRANARLGRILSELRFTGEWSLVRSWTAKKADKS